MRVFPCLIAISVLTLAAQLPALAQSPAPSATQGERILDRVITELERQIIERYFGGKKDGGKNAGQNGGKGSKQMPPGLAKRDSLPPGLEMQLVRNGTLPPGLAKRDLPDDLLRDLPRRPRGQKLVIVDRDVVLIEEATEVILDILEGVAAGS